MDNDKSVEHLLKQVTNINRRYDEIARISGENFNIFNILNLDSKELIHSKIISMLLNPNGEHGMGNLFLKYFIDVIKLEEKGIGIDISDVKIITEKPVTDGRTDISIITKDDEEVIMENKINAPDQDMQLLNYYNASNNPVLYLTLNGHEPDKISVKELEKNRQYFCISYKEHILKWLEMCIKDTVNSPFLRETLNQYILLIKQLTGQARRNVMDNEILDLITKNEENLKSYLIVNEINKTTVLNHLKIKTRNSLEKIAKKYDLILEETEDDILSYQYGYKFYKEKWCKDISIWFTFAENLAGMSYGIYSEEGKGKWYVQKPMEKYWNCKNTEILAKLCCPDNDVIKEIENKLEELIPKVEEMLNQQ